MHFISVMKTFGEQDYPIATAGTALRWAINSIPAGSHINLYPETPEIYDALKVSNEILPQGWDTQMYCTVP
jgi:hypothetical protein